MTDRYGADRQVPFWHAELRPESRDQRGRDPEEQRAEALVDGGEQHQQRQEPGVDVPVRHRPPCLVTPGSSSTSSAYPCEPSRWRPVGRGEQPVRDALTERLAGERAHHAPFPDHIAEFHPVRLRPDGTAQPLPAP